MSDRLTVIKEVCEKRMAAAQDYLDEEYERLRDKFSEEERRYDPFAAMKEAGMRESDFH